MKQVYISCQYRVFVPDDVADEDIANYIAANIVPDEDGKHVYTDYESIEVA